MNIAINGTNPLRHYTDTAPKKPYARQALTNQHSRGHPGAEMGNRDGVKFLRKFEAENDDFAHFWALPRGPLRSG